MSIDGHSQLSTYLVVVTACGLSEKTADKNINQTNVEINSIVFIYKVFDTIVGIGDMK